MLSLNPSLDAAMMDLNVAGVGVQITAPANVLAVLEQTMASVPRTWSGDRVLDFSVTRATDTWEIRADASGNGKMLRGSSALPEIAGALVSAVMYDVAKLSSVIIPRACIIERDGQAIAFVGSDWESSITITAHLHTRGWRLLGGDYAVIDPQTMDVVPFAKLLYVNSDCVGSLPLAYRPALEASPWYSTEHGIAFYAVDPGRLSKSAWSPAGRLSAVIVVDGLSEARPSLDSIPGGTVGAEALDVAMLRDLDVRVARLRLGNIVDTCDLIETWFGTDR